MSYTIKCCPRCGLQGIDATFTPATTPETKTTTKPATTRLPMTEAEIDAGRSANGGFTRAILAGWGIPWPAKKGWRKELLARARAQNGGR